LVFLGVGDNGSILGIAPDVVTRIKSEFVTTINNSNKFYPPLYLKPEVLEIEGKLIILICERQKGTVPSTYYTIS